MSNCIAAGQSFEEQTAYPIIENTTTQNDKLILSVRQSVEQINCHEIYFLESRGHNVYIYFHQCHKSYIVNFEQVAHLEKTQFSMTDGRIVPVSRMHQAETKAAYQSFIEFRAEI